MSRFLRTIALGASTVFILASTLGAVSAQAAEPLKPVKSDTVDVDGFDGEITKLWNIFGIRDHREEPILASALTALETGDIVTYSDPEYLQIRDKSTREIAYFEVVLQENGTVAGSRSMPMKGSQAGQYRLAPESRAYVLMDADYNVIGIRSDVALTFYFNNHADYWYLNSTRYRYLYYQTHWTSDGGWEETVPETYLTALDLAEPTNSTECTGFRAIEAVLYITSPAACAVLNLGGCLAWTLLDYAAGYMAQESCYGD